MKKIILIILLLFTINVKGETITVSSKTTIKDKTIEDDREQSNVLIVDNGNLDNLILLECIILTRDIHQMVNQNHSIEVLKELLLYFLGNSLI